MTLSAIPSGEQDIAGQQGEMIDLRDAGRLVLLVATLLVYWISLAPFHDRSNADLTGTIGDASNVLNQLVYPIVALLVAGSALATKPSYFRSFAIVPFVGLCLWLLICGILSASPATGIKRALFELFVVATACGTLTLPKSQRQLATVLAIASIAVLVLCFLGVALLPALAIHSAADLIEPDLAGNWRGFFSHKNQAGAMMAILIFTGMFIAEARNRVLGYGIAIASAVFLLFTVSKTTTALVPFVLMLAALVSRAKSTLSRTLWVLPLLVAINVGTVGSSWPGPVRSFVGLFITDTTFTARTDLWRFSANLTAGKPIFGYGMAGPWRTPELMYRDRLPPEPEDISGWVEELGTDSHNSYLEGALQFGVPGLLVMICALIAVPLMDFGTAARSPENEVLLRYFSRIWIYVLYLAALETILITRNNPVWFMMLLAILGLRLMASRRVAAGP